MTALAISFTGRIFNQGQRRKHSIICGDTERPIAASFVRSQDALARPGHPRNDLIPRPFHLAANPWNQAPKTAFGGGAWRQKNHVDQFLGAAALTPVRQADLSP
jgi:hypothetical protein